jgi:hypothetical protein
VCVSVLVSMLCQEELEVSMVINPSSPTACVYGSFG